MVSVWVGVLDGKAAARMGRRKSEKSEKSDIMTRDYGEKEGMDKRKALTRDGSSLYTDVCISSIPRLISL